MSEIQTTPAPLVRPTTMTFITMVERYVALRNKVTEIKKRHTDELAQFNVVMAALEGWMMADLNAAGANSMKTDYGTAYITTRSSVTVQEWSKTLDFIRNGGYWELLEARVNKTMAEELIKEGTVIPGIHVVRDAALNVRKT